MEMKSDSKLLVLGHLLGNGTATSRIVINGTDVASSTIDAKGTADLEFTNVHAQTTANDNGILPLRGLRLFQEGHHQGDAALDLDRRRRYRLAQGSFLAGRKLRRLLYPPSPSFRRRSRLTSERCRA